MSRHRRTYDVTVEVASPADQRAADRFLDDLMGRPAAMPPAPLPLAPAPASWSPAPPPALAPPAPSTTGPAQIFDRIVQEGASGAEVFFESEAGEAESGEAWTAVALPGSATPLSRFAVGDLVLQRGLGDAQLANVLVLGEDVQAGELYGPDGLLRRDTLVLRETAPAPPGPAPTPTPTVPPPTTTAPVQPARFRIVDPRDRPIAGARWSVHQRGSVFQGTADAQGWTGPFDPAAGRFDGAQPFRIHVEGCVCSIVSGAALVAGDPDVEYGGQFVDWSLADDPDPQKSRAFWDEYKSARKLAGPLDVFHFLQHDHVMRRPVKLLARQAEAVFEARPLAIRLGPLVRYTDTARALIWLELETPGLVRVTYGKAQGQRDLPQASEVPAAQSRRHGTSVRVGGRHYALVCLDGLEADTAYQYTIALAPQPPVGALPVAEADFTEAAFPRQPAANHPLKASLKAASFAGSEWLFFRTAPRRSDPLRFAHGSCRKHPGDTDEHGKVPDSGPDMLETFGLAYLGDPRRTWAEWPRFFIHLGDQVYADDVGVNLSTSIVRHRFAAVLPGPRSSGTVGDVAFGAWAGRFAARYARLAPAGAPARSDLTQLRSMPHQSQWDIEYQIGLGQHARRQAEFVQKYGPKDRELAAARMGRPSRFKLRVLNGLLWEVQAKEEDIPRFDQRRGLLSRKVYRIQGPPAQEIVVEHPSAGDVGGVHAADYAEYAAVYGQAWSTPGARRVLAHLPSFMIFDDHEVADDWNADRQWLKIVHTRLDPFRYWPTTMTDALCAYWVYQGWGNLAPEQWESDPRVRILERNRRQGRDALPELRRLVSQNAVQTLAPGARPSGKLDWSFAVPTHGIPFLAVDLRMDREVNGAGGMSAARLQWLEQALASSTSPVAFVVLPVPYLMPDPILFIFRNPSFTARLAGARTTTEFRWSGDVEHPAGNPVWNQIRDLMSRLQRSATLKTVVFLSGDIHFACNLDGILPGSPRPPRLLQLVSSPMRHKAPDSKRKLLFSAYKGWLLNMISRSQGVDEHRGMRITVGGLRGPGGALQNFLFPTSLALVDVTVKEAGSGPARVRVPLVQQTHLVRPDESKPPVAYTFMHMTQPSGRAVMTLKDPGFDHPASPTDYPAAPGGVGVTFEQDEAEAPMPAEGNGDCPQPDEMLKTFQTLVELKKALDSDWKAMQTNPLILEVQMINELEKMLDMAKEVPRKVWGEIWKELKAFAGCDVQPLVKRVKVGEKHANAVLRVLHGLTSILQGYVHDQIDAEFKGWLDGKTGFGKAGAKLLIHVVKKQVPVIRREIDAKNFAAVATAFEDLKKELGGQGFSVTEVLDVVVKLGKEIIGNAIDSALETGVRWGAKKLLKKLVGTAAKAATVLFIFEEIAQFVDALVKIGSYKDALRAYNKVLLGFLARMRRCKPARPGRKYTVEVFWTETIARADYRLVLRSFIPKKGGKPGEGEWKDVTVPATVGGKKTDIVRIDVPPDQAGPGRRPVAFEMPPLASWPGKNDSYIFWDASAYNAAGTRLEEASLFVAACRP